MRYLRAELEIEVQRVPKKLPYVPTEDEIRRFYSAVWKERRGGDVVLIKTLMYTGVRVSELVAIRIADVVAHPAVPDSGPVVGHDTSREVRRSCGHCMLSFLSG